MSLLNITSSTMTTLQVLSISLLRPGPRSSSTYTKHCATNRLMILWLPLHLGPAPLRNLRILQLTVRNSRQSPSQREWHYLLPHLLSQRELRPTWTLANLLQRHPQRETRPLFPSLGEREMNLRPHHWHRQVNQDQQHLGLEQADEQSNQPDIGSQPC